MAKYSKIKYSIQELVELFKKEYSIEITQSHLRHIEKKFELEIERRNGIRKYTENDIKNIREIIYLTKQKKMTFAGAKDKLKNGKKSVEDNLLLIYKLEKIKEKLLTIKEEIK